MGFKGEIHQAYFLSIISIAACISSTSLSNFVLCDSRSRRTLSGLDCCVVGHRSWILTIASATAKGSCSNLRSSTQRLALASSWTIRDWRELLDALSIVQLFRVLLFSVLVFLVFMRNYNVRLYL